MHELFKDPGFHVVTSIAMRSVLCFSIIYSFIYATIHSCWILLSPKSNTHSAYFILFKSFILNELERWCYLQDH